MLPMLNVITLCIRDAAMNNWITSIQVNKNRVRIDLDRCGDINIECEDGKGVERWELRLLI